MKRGGFNKLLLVLSLILVSFNIFSGYINSWLIYFPVPSIGSVLRDLVFFLLMAMVFVHTLLIKKSIPYVVIVWCICGIYVSLLIPFSPNGLYAMMGMRNILYPFAGIVLICFAYLLKSDFCFFNLLLLWVRNLLFIAATLGILDFATDGGFIHALGFNPEYNNLVALMVRHHLGLTRANAGISDALNYGYLMAFSSIYAFYLIESSQEQTQSRFLQIFLRIFFIISIISCVLSITRGAIIAVIAAIVLHGLLRRSIFPLLIIFMMAFSLLVASSQSDDIFVILYDRFSENDIGSQLSSQQRFDSAIRSMELIDSNPLLGVGLGTQGAPSLFDVDDRRVATDNSFLWILLDTGIAGFIIVLLSYFSLFVYLYRAKAGQNYKKFVVLSGMIIFIAASLSSAPLSPTFAITFWVLLVSEAQVSKMKLHTHETRWTSTKR